MQAESGSILSHLNFLFSSRNGRKNSATAVPDDDKKFRHDEDNIPVSLVRMTKFTNVPGKQPAMSTMRGDTSAATPPPLPPRLNLPALSSQLPPLPKSSLPKHSASEKAFHSRPLPTPPPGSRRDSEPAFTVYENNQSAPKTKTNTHKHVAKSQEPSSPLPPPPPPRASSLNDLGLDFDSRFNFHPCESFPPPEPFSGGKKTYSSLMHSKHHNERPGSSPPDPPPPPPPR